MIKHQNIFFPEIGIHIRFRVLGMAEVSTFLEKNEPVSGTEYAINILKICVINLMTDVYLALCRLEREAANKQLQAIVNGCIALNPPLSPQSWVGICHTSDIDLEAGNFLALTEEFGEETRIRVPKKADKTKNFKMPLAKFKNMHRFLSERVIGQPEAIEQVCNSLKLYLAGLNDPDKPIGVLLYAGPSGVGKTLLAKYVHEYLFGDDIPIVRIDCEEYQHKHENQKLIGSPPGYQNHDEGGIFDRVKDNPYTVVLIDEIEKAHRDVVNTFLKIFDEGYATNAKGEMIDFRHTVVIMTSNLGNSEVAELINGKSSGFNAKIDVDFTSKNIPSRHSLERATKNAMQKFFLPEFINRIDETIIFNFLTHEDCIKITELQLGESANRIAKLGHRFTWSDESVAELVRLGYTAMSNARGIKNVKAKSVDGLLADRILATATKRGTSFYLNLTNDDKFEIQSNGPVVLPKRIVKESEQS